MACKLLKNGKESILYSQLYKYYLNEVEAAKAYAQITSSKMLPKFTKLDSNGEPDFDEVKEKYIKEKTLSGNQSKSIKTFEDKIKTLRFDEKKHEYTDNGKTVSGATETISNNAETFKEPTLRFSLEEYIAAITVEFEQDLKLGNTTKTRAQFDSEIKEKLKLFEVLPELGTKGHKIFETVLSTDLSSKQEIFEYSGMDLNSIGNDTIEDKIVESALKFKLKLKNKYKGQNVKFLVEQRLYNKKSKIAGTADLLVVLEDGSVDIYDYKFSSKPTEKWSLAKNLNIKYQQALYRNIINSYGIKVNSLNIMPINIDVDTNSKTISNYTEGDIYDLITQGGLTSSSKVVSDVNTLIKSEVKSEIIKNKDNTELLSLLNNLFDYDLTMSTTSATKSLTVDEFIERRDIIEKQKASYDGKYRYYNRFDGKSLSFTTEAALRESIRKYLEDEEKAKSDITNNLVRFILSKRDDIENNTNKASWSSSYYSNAAVNQFNDRVLDKYVSSVYRNKEGNIEYLYDFETNNVLSEMGIVLCINKKTGVVDVVSMVDMALDEQVRLANYKETKIGGAKGKSLLANFISHNEEVRLKGDVNLLNSTIGNIEAVKNIMFLLQSKTKLTVGDVTVLSTKSEPVKIPTDLLLDNVKTILDHRNVKSLTNLKSEDLDTYINKEDKLDSLVDYVSSLVDAASDTSISSITFDFKRNEFLNKLKEELEIKSKLVSNIGNLEVNENSSTNNLTSKKTIELLYDRQTFLSSKLIKKKITDTEINELALIAQVIINLTNQSTLYDEEDLANFKNLGFGESATLSNPDNITKNSIKALVALNNKANNLVRSRVTKEVQEFRPIIKELIKSKKTLKGSIVGDHDYIYDNMFVYRNVNGKYINTMVLRDPDSTDSGTKPGQTTLSSEERNFIKAFSKRVNATRKIENLEDSGRKYEVPLMRANAFKKLKEGKVKDAIAHSLRKISPDELADIKFKKSMETMTEMADFFSFQDNPDARESFFNANSVEGFNTNLETILYSFINNDIKSEEFNKVLPSMNAIKTTMLLSETYWFKKMDNIAHYVDDYIQHAVFKSPFLNEEELTNFQIVKPVKKALEIGALAFNPILGTTQLLTGIWANISALMGRYSDVISKKHYFKGATMMIGSTSNLFNNINFINYFNEEYGIADMQTNQFIHTMSEERGGLKVFFSRWMHWLNSAPDYYNRMSMFLAKASTDGVITITNGKIDEEKSAYTFDKENNKLVYNEKKDKRFSLLFKDGVDKTSKEYLDQLSLYEKLLAVISEEDGVVYDSLPRAYTNRQRDSFIKLANELHADFSPENKIKFTRTAMGSLIMQFKTWILSKKNMYYRETSMDGVMGDYESYIDEETGDVKYRWKGRMQEGILQSFYFMLTDIRKTRNLAASYRGLDDFQKRNIHHMISDLLLAMILIFIGDSLKSTKEDKKSFISNKIGSILEKSGKDLSIMHTVKAVQDSENYMAIKYTESLFLKTIGAVTDVVMTPSSAGETMESWIRNFGIGRSIYDIYDITASITDVTGVKGS